MFKKLSEVLPDEPIYFDLRQQLRRGVLTVNPGQKLVAIIVLVGIIAPVGFLVFQSGRYISPEYLMFGVTPLLSMLLPAVISPLIAGEYQRRSLEQLLAAPLGPRQIVLAKAMRGIIPSLMILGAVYLLALLTLLSKLTFGNEAVDAVRPAWLSMGGSTLVALVWAVFCVFSTIFVSSITRSTTSALLGSVGFQIALFVVVPGIVLPIVSMGSPSGAEWASRLHPLGMTHLFIMYDPRVTHFNGQVFVAVLGLCGYLAISIAFFFAASGRLERYRRTGFDNT